MNEYRVNGYRVNEYRMNEYRVNGYRVNGYRLNGHLNVELLQSWTLTDFQQGPDPALIF